MRVEKIGRTTLYQADCAELLPNFPLSGVSVGLAKRKHRKQAKVSLQFENKYNCKDDKTHSRREKTV